MPADRREMVAAAMLGMILCQGACLIEPPECMKTYYVYIMANKRRTLYTGVTNNLERRVYEHKQHMIPGFTRKYNIDHLVYFETWGDIRGAIGREKQIKGWLRTRKVALIIAKNPAWMDLSEGWYGTK